MNLKQLTKQRRTEYPKKMPTLGRIKAGRILMTIVALPLGTLWLFPVAATMIIPMKPSLWAKDKIRYFNEWRLLK